MLYIAFWHSVTQCLTTLVIIIEYCAEHGRRDHLVHVYIEEVKGLGRSIGCQGLPQLLQVEEMVLHQLVGEHLHLLRWDHHHPLHAALLHEFLLPNMAKNPECLGPKPLQHHTVQGCFCQFL